MDIPDTPQLSNNRDALGMCNLVKLTSQREFDKISGRLKEYLKTNNEKEHISKVKYIFNELLRKELTPYQISYFIKMLDDNSYMHYSEDLFCKVAEFNKNNQSALKQVKVRCSKQMNGADNIYDWKINYSSNFCEEHKEISCDEAKQALKKCIEDFKKGLC